MQHTLETYRLFPVIAWVLIISFSLFTAHLAYELQAATEAMVETPYQTTDVR